MMNNTSIVIFSSGNQEKIAKSLAAKISSVDGYECATWRDLFSLQEDSSTNVYALMPTLLKKVPTFDFAVIIGGADDTSLVKRGEVHTEYSTMRDNIIFEIGLCVMALGQERTILVADETVRFIDDFIGLTGAKEVDRDKYPEHLKPHHLGFKCITYNHDEFTNMTDSLLSNTVKQILQHVDVEKSLFKPIVIGASCSTAVGYVDNFVERVVDAIANKYELYVGGNIKCKDDGGCIDLSEIDEVIFDIHLFGELNPEYKSREDYYLSNGLESMFFLKGGSDRGIFFHAKREGKRLVIVDIPTTISTSYSTAKKLLSLEANDTQDKNDESRFIRKEIRAFVATFQRQVEALNAKLEANKIKLSIKLVDIKS